MPTIFRVVDLFAGCGGLTAGLKSTGRYESVGAVELDHAAAATYAENFGPHVYQGDISAWLDEGNIPAADIVVGGPPCQGFSNLGKRLNDDPRNELWREYVRTLNIVKPKVFVLENVDRFLTSDQYAQLVAATKDGTLDYELDSDVVVAAAFGSSQIRRRAIVIGTRRGIQPIAVPEPVFERDSWRTVKDALLGVMERVVADNRQMPARMLTRWGKSLPGAFSTPELHVTRHYEPRSLERFSHIPTGGNRFNLPFHLQTPGWRKHTSGSADVMGRLRWDRPSVTIRTEFFKPEKGRYLHPSEDRAITHYEAARLQGFPEEFKWCGNKLQIARQIGNAVPVELAENLGRYIAEELDRRDSEKP